MEPIKIQLQDKAESLLLIAGSISVNTTITNFGYYLIIKPLGRFVYATPEKRDEDHTRIIQRIFNINGIQ